MHKELLKKFTLGRRFLLSAVATISGLMLLMVMQPMGTAAAGTDAARTGYLDGCPSGQACLWINAADDADPAVRADRRALVVTPGSGPDLDQPTPYDLGAVHGMTAEFTDNISVGVNNLPTELCLLDTTESGDGEKFGTKAPLRRTNHIIVVPPWSPFSRLGDQNDSIDYYTTGQCPRGNIIFRSDTGAILDRY